MVPPNGVEIRLWSSVRPTLPGVSVAPMTATVRGAKNASSGCLSWRNTSCARLAAVGSGTTQSLRLPRGSRGRKRAPTRGRHTWQASCSLVDRDKPHPPNRESAGRWSHGGSLRRSPSTGGSDAGPHQGFRPGEDRGPARGDARVGPRARRRALGVRGGTRTAPPRRRAETGDPRVSCGAGARRRSRHSEVTEPRTPLVLVSLAIHATVCPRPAQRGEGEGEGSASRCGAVPSPGGLSAADLSPLSRGEVQIRAQITRRRERPCRRSSACRARPPGRAPARRP